MSNEQNLNGFLEMLKNSVPENEENEYTQPSEEYSDISQDDLKARLKNKFLFDDATEANATESEYQLDADFLDEFSGAEEDNEDTSDIKAEVHSAELFESKEISFAESLYSVSEQSASSDKDDLGLPWYTEVDMSVAEEVITEEYDEAVTDDGDGVELADIISDEDISLNDEDSELDERLQLESIDELLETMSRIINTEDAPSEDILIEAAPNEATVSEAETVVEASDVIVFDDQEQVYADSSLDNLEDIPIEAEATEASHKTFLASIRETGIEFTTDEIYNSTVNSVSDIADEQDDVRMELSEEDNDSLDLSTINLMMQFCEKEEVEQTIGNQKMDDFLKYENESENESSKVEDQPAREYTGAEQNENIQRNYKGKLIKNIFSAIGCTMIAALTLMFEILPLFEIQFDGFLDYEAYPIVYALIGLQFVIAVSAICYKQLWRGLKRAFSLSPERHSVVALILCMTVLYDIIMILVMAFSGEDFLPLMYNGIAAALVAVMSISDYLAILIESKSFDVYSSDGIKYTLTKESRKDSIGSKMYDGGLSEDKSIYTTQKIDFPNGFFRSVSASQKSNKLLVLFILPVAIIAMVASIVNAVLYADAYSACASFVLCIYLILPMALSVTDILPYAIAITKLSKRGSAFAGIPSIEKYEKCDVAVFHDLHLFKKCKTETVGFVVYDTGVGYLVLGCIDALYSKIGGPLSGLQINLPDVFKFNNVCIRRMSRNGIEAVIDGKHTLIVGEHAFMQRYGLEFPPNEKETKYSTLCVSLNGKITAKISVKYEIDPVFEMLAERLAGEGIGCAIHTFDPLINGNLIAELRTIGNSPISVVHKTVEDFSNGENNKRYRTEADGVVSVGSRLNLAELIVWIKRLVRLKKINTFVAVGFSLIGLVVSALLVVFEGAGYVNQLYLLLFLVLELIAMISVMVATLPSSKYFTVERLYSELEKAHSNTLTKKSHKTKKQNSNNKKKEERN